MKKIIKASFLFLGFITLSMGVALGAPLVESVAISGDKLIVTGHQFLDIDSLALSDPKTGFIKPFKVESATESEIVGTAVDNQKITVASLMNLIIDTAKGETIYPVSFSLQKDAVTNPTIKNGAITPEKFIGVTTTNPPDQSVLTWDEPTQSFIFTSPSGGGSSGVSDIILGAGITGAPNTASGSVPISVDIGTTGNTSKTKIPYFNSKNKIVLDSTTSPAGSLTGLSFKDGNQNFYMFNDNGLRITSNVATDVLVLGVDGNLALKGPVTIGGYDVCLSGGNCTSVSGISNVTASAPLVAAASATGTINISPGAVNTANNLVKLDSAGKFPSTIPGVVRGPGTVASGAAAIYSGSSGENLGKTAYTIPSTSGVTGQILALTATNTVGWINTPASGVTSFKTRTGAVVPAAGDYTATLISSTAGGSVSATSVQAAITELDTEKLPKVGGTMTGTITTTTQNALKIGPAGSVTGEVQFLEPTAAGTNYVGFKSPASLAANTVWTLPAADGTSGQVLSTNGSNVLSWTSAGAGGGVTSVPGDTSPLPLENLDSTIAIYSGEDGQTIRYSLWKLNGIQLQGPTAFIGENSTFKGMGVGCFSHKDYTSSNAFGYCQNSSGNASFGFTNKVVFGLGGINKLEINSTDTINSQSFVNNGNFTVDTNTFFVDATTNSVGVGTATPTQAFQIDSTTKGLLPPRMTTTQKNAITPQTTGLVVFDTTTNSLNVRNSTGWASLGSGGSGTGNVAGPATSILNNLATYSDATGKIIKDSGINSSNLPTMAANATAQFQPILSGGINKSQIAAPYTFPDRNCLPGEILKWNTTGFTCQADLGGLSSVPGDTSPLPLDTLDSTIAIYSGEDGQTIKYSNWKLNGIQLQGPTAFIGENSIFKNLGVGCFSHKDYNSSNAFGFCQNSSGNATIGIATKANFAVGGTNRFEIATATTNFQSFVNNGNFTVDTNTFFVDATADSVGIGTITPVQAFQIDSTTKGFLPPRMTTTQKNAITPQTPGLVIFDTTTNSLNVRNSTGWLSLGSGGSGGTGNVAGPASSKANNLATYSDTTGKVLLDSGVSQNDLVTMSGSGSIIAGNVVVTSGTKLVADSTINITNIPTMPANAPLQNAPILGVAGQKVQVAAPYTLPNKTCTAGQILKWDTAAAGFTCQADMGGLSSVPGDTSPLPLENLDSTIAIYSGEDGQTIRYSLWKLNGIQLQGPTAFIGENSTFKNMGVGCFSHKDFTSSNAFGYCQNSSGNASFGFTNKVVFSLGGIAELEINATDTINKQNFVNTGNFTVDTNTFFVDATTNSVGVGTATPTQAFQIDSTTKGFLPPRMTTTQKNAISPQTPG